MGAIIIQDILSEFTRYKMIGEKAITQVSDEALNKIPCPDGNSIAMVVRHLSGSLKSRFTDFLTSDGEKPWRQRDMEFAERTYTRSEVDAMWSAGFEVVEKELAKLTDADLETMVTIRGVPLTVHQALCRSVVHAAYHAGQVVVLARILAQTEWRWITVPKGKSEEYNRNPTREKMPR